ncbi:MAG: ankyrin repeat domain-containing protein [Phycisphaerae bacterium]|nr:ankyrin repeat domain-containing protein [Phycisphaerae bacterium]
MKKLTALTLAIALFAACIPAQGEPADEKAKDSGPVAKLHAAAKEGDTKAIGQLLSSGAKVDARDQSGSTPLFVASLFGRTDAAKLLIKKGADIKGAKGTDGSTALHVAAFFCYTDTVKLLLKSGANINALNNRSDTPLDAVSGAWSEGLGEFYTGVAKALGLKIDLDSVKAARPKIAALLKSRGGKTGRKPAGNIKDVAALGIRCSYYCNGRIHVGVLGTPDGKPITEPPVKSWEDFKPSWSKTGDMLVFFRRVKNDPNVINWKTKICIIKTDGTGFHELTDGTGTNFNQTWTRNGTNTPIWNRKNPKTGGFIIMKSKIGAKPGQEVPITDPRYHNWAYSCLIDGRILVMSAHPKQGWGYFLMTPKPNGKSIYQRIDTAGLARKGLLDRISISPSEDKVCFEHQIGHKHNPIGRTLYVADFDAKKRVFTNVKPFANLEKKQLWFAYPRWTKGEKAIVYHANRTLRLYTLKSGVTTQVSTNPRADYRYPHGERMPK